MQANSESQSLIDLSSLKSTSKSLTPLQKVFRRVCIVLFCVLIFCIPGFLKFRQYCQYKGYYVFSASSLKWCVLGFFIIFVTNLLFRQLRRVTSDGWKDQSHIWSVLPMRELPRTIRFNGCWKWPMTLFSIWLLLCAHTSLSKMNIGSPLQLEVAELAHKFTGSIPTGPRTNVPNLKFISVSSWECICILSSS